MYGSPDGVRYCQQCERTTSMVLDHDTGDAICTECAIVLGNGNDPRRPAVASAATKHGGADAPADDDPLLQGSDVVAAAAAEDAGRCRGAEGFDAIDNMASRLGLAGNVRDRGKDVLRKVEEAKVCARGRSRDALYAACLHTACRMEGAPRTLKELIAATPDAAATKRDLGKFIHAIKRLLGSNDEEAEAGQDQAGSKATNGCGGRSKSVREVSAATGVSESTIKDAYKDLCQHAEVLFG
uniref:TFIIB-type domain-containing protein n=1 Tax=Oryza barthii TaxID=65489 RepID=A0A0D3GRD1_9ORYZ